MSVPNDAVTLALRCIDESNNNHQVTISAAAKVAVDAVLDSKKNNSDKVALLFFLAYKKLEPNWDCKSVPRGWRPADKVLAAGLTDRDLTLHGNITSPGENMGIKGQAAGFDLFRRNNLGPALQYVYTHPKDVEPLLRYVACRFKASYNKPIAIAGPGPRELVFTRAYQIAHRLIFADSGGHFPQFLVASLLASRFDQWDIALMVSSYHPNASDTFGRAAGDVEVRDQADRVVDAYEVTVRPDWKNRRPDLLKKMAAFGLPRYNLLCLIEPGDVQLGSPDTLHSYMSELRQDIAVLDIRAFAAASIQDLDREHRRRAFELLEKMVRDPKLCGIPKLISDLKAILES